MTIVIRAIATCAACERPIEHYLGLSGHSFGAERWTDGLLDAPMLQSDSRLVMCPHCGSGQWLESLKHLWQQSRWDEEPPESLKDAIPHTHPTFPDYLAMLRNGNVDKAMERYLSSPFRKFAHVFVRPPASRAGFAPNERACARAGH